MPKTITTRLNTPKIRPDTFRQTCPSDKTRCANPIRDIYNRGNTQTKPITYRSTTRSTSARCNRAVQLAEREWDPKKIYETDGENRGTDITRYRYGVDADFAWCATFVNYLYNPNHTNGQNILGMSDKDVMSTQKILKRAKELDCFAPANNQYTPKVGDIIVWKSDSDGSKGHVGIVTEVREDGSFITIQGNNNNKVEKIEYDSVSDAMTRISNSGVSQTLQGFVKMSEYNNSHNLAEARTSENDSLISDDATSCWMG